MVIKEWTQKSQIITDMLEDTLAYTILRGAETMTPWCKVTLNLFDAAGDLVTDLSGITGTVDIAAFWTASFFPQTAIAPQIDLSSGVWTVPTFFGPTSQFQVVATGMNTGYTYQLTFTSWSDEL